jgi:undecaprenyl-diphosphatase
VETLLELAEPWLYILVFTLAAAEGAALVGLVLPGESSMLLAGVVVYEGDANAFLVYLCGIAGAVIGDSIGYWVGHRFGPRLRRSRLGRRVGEPRWEKAGRYLRERGGSAVFFGRFAGFLRTLVPPVAGQAHMPYARFFAYNAPAASLWAVVFISLGVAAGSSWHTVERWAGRASAFIAILVVVVVLAIVLARWLYGHKQVAVDLWRGFLAAPVVRSLRARYSKQIGFMRRRFDPAERFGLYFSAGAVAALAMGVALAGLVDALREGDVGPVDRSIASFAERNRTSEFDGIADAITTSMNAMSLTAAVALVAIAAWKLSGRASWLLEGAAAGLGSAFLDDLVRGALGLLDLRPPSWIPSGEAIAATILAGVVLYICAVLRGWRVAVWAGAAGATLIAIVTLAHMYEGVYASELAGGVVLGVMWLGICGASVSQLTRLPRSDRATT